MATLTAQVASIDRVEPSALRPGHTTRLTFVGDNLTGPAELWTSFPAKIQPAPTSSSTAAAASPEKPLQFDVTMDPGIGPGLGAMRVITTNGISRWSLVLIDPLPTVDTARDTNASAKAGPLLAMGSATDGKCDELQSDYFRIHGRKGDRVCLDVIARQFGSPMDPWLRLIRPDGREEAVNDDAPGGQGDAGLIHRWTQTGEHRLEIRDTQYRGGRRYRYHLRVGSEPTPPLRFFGSTLAKTPNPALSLRESEPNDTPRQAQWIPAEGSLRGTFGRSHDRDLFVFDAKKGERWIIRGRTRSLGSPCDLYLRLNSTNGTKIAAANIGPDNEGSITNTFTETGTFQLLVEELNHRGGDGLFYRIDLEPFGPACVLSTEKESLQLAPGGSEELVVNVERREYDGEIRIEGQDLAVGFQLTNQVIKAKEKQTKLRITAPADARPGQWFHCRFIGRPAGAKVEFVSAVTTMPALRAIWSEMSYPPEALDGWIAISVR